MFSWQDSISAVIAKYSRNGYIDILQEKWYGGLPCFKLATDMAQPRPLGVAAVTGQKDNLNICIVTQHR
jgi:ionotropic glutamate receptor NMDA 3A